VFYGNPDAETPEGADTNLWTVTGHAFPEPDDDDSPGLLFASSADGRNPDDPNPNRVSATLFGFVPFPHDDANLDPDDPNDEDDPKRFDLARRTVRELPRDNRVARYAHFFKIEAALEEVRDGDGNTGDVTSVNITPASRPVRLQVSSQIRPARIRVDYRREIAALRAGMAYAMGPHSQSDVNQMNPTAFEIVDRAAARAGILFRGDDETALFTKEIGTGNAEITYWTAARGNRPRSPAQTVRIHNFSGWSGTDTSAVRAGRNAARGTFRLPRGYEVRAVGSEGRWRTSVGRITSTMEFEIRRRGNARFDATGAPWLRAGTATASHSRILTVTVDTFQAGTDKNNQPILRTGVTDVQVTEFPVETAPDNSNGD
jgi:hypothetical protein